MTYTASASPQIVPIARTPHVLGEQLGGGGYSTVVAARPVGQSRTIAVKILRPSLARDHRMVELFKSEAGMLAALDHPGLPGFIEAGQWASGHYYIAMERAGQRTLEQEVQRVGPLSVRGTAQLGVEICEVLAYLHDENLRHGDIKPSNVMVDRVGRAVLVDLGLTDTVARRRTKDVSGTPNYLAPEQFAGGPVDQASDIYSLGASLYLALTGEKVFFGDNVAQLCHQHLYAHPIAPSCRVGRHLTPGIDRIVLSCLSKSPRDRPTARELMAALSELRNQLDLASRSQRIA